MTTVTINLSEEDIREGKARRMLVAEDAFRCLSEVDSHLRIILKNHEVPADIEFRLLQSREGILDVLSAGAYE
jgi:hypothetical protein